MILTPVVVDMDVGDNYVVPIDVETDQLIDVDVSGTFPIRPYNLQSKEATPTDAEQIILPDAGVDGLSRVIVHPIPSCWGYIQWIDGHLRIS